MPVPDWQSLDPQAVIAVAAVVALALNAISVLIVGGQATAGFRMIREVRIDRDLAHRPYLVYANTGADLPQSGGVGLPIYTITNVGRGPALSIRFHFFEPRQAPASGVWLTAEPDESHLAAGNGCRAVMVQATPEAVADMEKSDLLDMGGWDEWNAGNREIWVLLCTDQFGKQHRFRSSVPETLAGRRRQRWKAWS